jgi:hypothetical protein
MSRRNQPFRRHRTRGRFRALYTLLSAVLICAAIVGGSIVFFRVRTVEVSGASRYTQSELIAASGIQDGDNLFLINKFSVVPSMFKRLPYLDTIMIRRRLPDTMVITVTECTPAAVLETESGGWLMDKRTKLLEQAAGSYPRVIGLTPLSSTASPRQPATTSARPARRISRHSKHSFRSLGSTGSPRMWPRSISPRRGASRSAMTTDSRCICRSGAIWTTSCAFSWKSFPAWMPPTAASST